MSQIITRYSMLGPGDRAGVAVSGGADSVVLLHVFHRLASTLALKLAVLHVNHGLRGAESDADETFVRELAGSLGLPFLSTRAAPGPGNLEQEARLVRREFFASCRARHALSRIALGHTRSDQAETVLYRFLRGSGLAGLAGMRPVTADGLIRPLLGLNRQEVRDWARTEGFVWREDSSNTNDSFARNLIRNSVLPQLSRDFNPNLEAILAGTAEMAAAEEYYWQELIGQACRSLIKNCALGLLISAKSLGEQPVAIQRRVVRAAIEQLRGDLRSIDYEHVESILRICQTEHGHDRVIIPGIDAIRSFGTLLLTRPGEMASTGRNYRIDLSWNRKITLPFGAGEIELRVLNSNAGNCVTVKKESQFHNESADLSIEVLSASGVRLQIRNWRPGDGIVRAGRHKPEKIKSLFQESQILLWQRRHWPVATVNEDVFWTRQFGGSAAYLASSESTSIARLIYTPGED